MVRTRIGAKHARIHLSIAGFPLDNSLFIDRDRTSALRKSMEISGKVVASFTQLLNSYKTLEQTLNAFKRRKAEEVRGFYNFPESALAFAFTLAATGNKTEAENEIDIVLRNDYFPMDMHDTIKSILNKLSYASDGGKERILGESGGPVR
jgi:hypothetical protein